MKSTDTVPSTIRAQISDRHWGSRLANTVTAAGLLLFASNVWAGAPYSFDAAPGKLPKDVVPTEYRIAIVPNIADRTFTGTETVALQVRSATGKIMLNTLNLTLRDVRLDGKPVAQVTSDEQAQTSTFTLSGAVKPGTHSLSLAYSGHIGSDPKGLFAQPYTKPEGGEGLLLSTKMEATDARRMFPCWDEPAFRARFQLTATVPADWATVGNMPVLKRVVHGTLATTTFATSPRMPSYLVEFTAGDLRELSGKEGNVGLGVWAVRGREADGADALKFAGEILADYNDYFGYAFPLPKLDSIAIPGGFSGAMENWGANTYTSESLLLTPASSIAQRQQVFSTMAHEMAHQWNGDLVTMGWWDDLWLNESFASWRAAKETDARNPSWKWWETQDGDKEAAMRADARPSSHAIQAHVVDELQADNAFDPEITYSKGQAVLRMFEAYLGPDTFRDGIRRFMKAHAFGNASAADLWNALSAASGRDVGAIASDWTEQAGFPLVSVAAQCDGAGARTITLSEQRFLQRGAAAASSAALQWKVPLQIRSGAQGTPQTLLLTQSGQTAPAGSCAEPLSIDAGALGFYRAAYDQATLAVNTHAFGQLPDGDRTALLDDQWALVGDGKAELPSYLALASGMGDDLDTRAWEQIAEALGIIEYDERGTAGHDAFAAYARSIIDPAAARLGWDARSGETPNVQDLRRLLLTDLAVWGDQKVIAEARRRFDAFLRDPKALKNDDQMMILSIVGKYADQSTYDQLHSLAKQAKDESEKLRFYIALSEVRDAGLAEQTAKIALDPEIPAQAVQWRLQMLFRLQREHPQLAWKHFTDNAPMLMAPFGHVAAVIEAQYVPQGFWNSVPPDQLESWLKTQVPAEMAPMIATGMDAARVKIAEKAALVPAADAYLAAHGSATPSGAAGSDRATIH